MKALVRKVLGSLAVCAVIASGSMAYAYGYTNYNYGQYQYGQGYGQTGYTSSYYSGGYNGYSQGYQGYYQNNTGYSGMGNSMQYVDNNWIEDQLRFATQDVSQNRPYNAMSRLQQVSGYIQKFGDTTLYRRIQGAMMMGYKSTFRSEVNSLFNEWKQGQHRLGWESAGNQSYMGQDDISKSYVISKLTEVSRDLSTNHQNRGRSTLYALISAIPPMGNERLVRRIQYAATVSRPSQMKTEVDTILSEIRSGALMLNDTQNTAANFYGTSISPYTQPDTGMPGGMSGWGNQNPNYGQQNCPNGGVWSAGAGQCVGTGLNPGTSTGMGQTYPGNQTGALPGFDTLGYQQGTDAGNAAYAPTSSNTTAAPTPPAPDTAQLKANVEQAYNNLKRAIASGEQANINDAKAKYAEAQKAYEAAK